jgi:hypothetical protein
MLFLCLFRGRYPATVLEPFLCNGHEIGGYTKAVSGQRLVKHVPVARQQILNNATVGLQQWKSCVFYVVRAERL